MAEKAEENAEHLSAVFAALGNPVRLRILQLVSETRRPLHIKAVAKALRMDYAAVYRHVDILKRTGLVQIFDVGRSRVLSLSHADLIKKIFAFAHQIENK